MIIVAEIIYCKNQAVTNTSNSNVQLVLESTKPKSRLDLESGKGIRSGPVILKFG